MGHRLAPDSRRRSWSRGFSLIEMLVTLTVLAMVIGALTTVLLHATFSRVGAKNRFESMQTARSALDMIARDLRSAGYGTDATHPAGAQPAIAYVDSLQILVCENLTPYPDTASATGAPQAYDPAGLPRPNPLVNTTYTPPVKYSTGAELVRWTLDLNDDGLVNADDVAAAEGADARRSRNPDDFTLVRQVYGAGSGGSATNNGGVTERIALVLEPGGAVAPMFTVYLNGSVTPWNWAWGPVPASSLASITRVVVKITAPSGRADSRGAYHRTLLETAVGSMRNAPNFGATSYTVDGWVYDDANASRIRESGEAGLQGAVVRLGTGRVTYTTSAGYFSFQVPAGTYTLKHTPPSGYGSYSNPDSFTLNVAANDTRSFADTARTGGWISVHAWSDDDGDGSEDAGEAPHAGALATLTPGGQVASTDASGDATLFAQSGSWSVSLSPPANHTVTTPNPRTGTMVNGASVAVSFGLLEAGDGSVSGTVYNDANGNGTQDGGESGISGVTVSAYDGGTALVMMPGGAQGNDLALLGAGQPGAGAWGIAGPGFTIGQGSGVSAPWSGSGGSSLLGGTIVAPLLNGLLCGTAVTDANGRYTLTLPALSGLLHKLYTVSCASVSGKQPTTPLSIDHLTLTAGQTTGGCNFGFGGYTTKSWSTGELTNLVARDVWENDNTGSTASPRTNGDTDLVDAENIIFVPTIQYWYDVHPTSPPFSGSNGAITIFARNSYAMALDTLGNAGPHGAPDLVTGHTDGNHNWWYWKRSTGSASPPVLATGIYTTADQGDVNALLTIDCSGGAMPDVLVGTRSSSGHGAIEVWQNSDASTPVFSRVETYPASGSIPGAHLGEVNGMALADLDLDGARDLVIVTSTSSTSGEIVVMRNSGRVNGDRFVYRAIVSLPSDAAKKVALADIDGDGYPDIVVGTQTSSTTGRLLVYRNTHAASSWTFAQYQAWSAPGAVTALAAADLGGSGASDIAVGYLTSTTTLAGGVRLYYNQSGALSTSAVDPGGSIAKSVVAIATGNFNYATAPGVTAGPHLTDFAVAYNTSTLAGKIVVFVR